VRACLAVFFVGCTILFSVFAYYYVQYQKIVDERMSRPVFRTTAQIYGRPKVVETGDKTTAEQIAVALRRAGYSDSGTKEAQSRAGAFRVRGTAITVEPGPESYHSSDPATLQFAGGKLEKIKDSAGHELDAYELEPILLTSLSASGERSKQRVVTYDDIPKVLVDAVTSIEDRRFFEHSGINYYRFFESAWTNLRSGHYSQGGSTITMQVARAFFLTPDKRIKRKLKEMLIALELEQRFSKKQIFALYANEVDMGQRGSFTIRGLAEASRAYFNKDMKDVTLPEAALLAGLIQRPSYLSPYRHAERAQERRNLVLESMVETGAITRAQADAAKATPLKLAPMNVEASDAPYFVDLLKDTLNEHYNENELNAHEYRIYSTIDPDLQVAAATAVENGMKNVDEMVRKQRTRKVRIPNSKPAKYETKVLPGPEAQVAMVVLDPHTGEILALVGGRNYGTSQLDHAVRPRPTGSSFKPFVYAAAVNTAVTGAPTVFTEISQVDDSQGSFAFGDQIYEPRNYKDEYHGPVPARYALAMSLNNATVRLAEQVGYDNVAALAKAAGINSVKPTPAMALGSYEASPLDIAQAYTVFANGGVRVSANVLRSLRDAQGNVLEEPNVQMRQVLDPRVAYVITNMMEGVLNYGLGFTVRRLGFTAPAAGKTGSSHDAWFAGYTSNLLCVVWLGFDDYTNMGNITGGIAAAPIWADFMKRATALPRYSNLQPFTPPTGVVVLKLDKVTNRLATASCPDDYYAAFIAGTEPKDTCDGGGILTRLGNIFTGGDHGNPGNVVPPPQPGAGTTSTVSNQPATQAPNQTQNQSDDKKKKGFWGKVFGAFKSDEQKNDNKQQPNPR
jgi:penicillin-binding protein 1B